MVEGTTQPNAPTGSRSTTLIRADQIEGLPDLIRQQVREVLREEVKSAPEDMDQLRRSPAGTMIRLEEQVKALDMKVDQRFEVVDERFKALDEKVDQRFETLKSEMDQRFQAVDQRFVGVDRRFVGVDQRFDSLERRLSLIQWVVILNTSLLIALVGKFFLMK